MFFGFFWGRRAWIWFGLFYFACLVLLLFWEKKIIKLGREEGGEDLGLGRKEKRILSTILYGKLK